MKHGFSYDKHGWKYIHIYGSPRERGYAYGSLCATQFREIQTMLAFFMMESFGKPWTEFVTDISRDFKEMTKTHFLELYEEMEGIVHGLNDHQCKTSIDEIIAWNFYMSIPYYYSAKDSHDMKEGGGVRERDGTRERNKEEVRKWREGIKDHCSAFMAVGTSWTEDGGIVCAHNSFADYIDGQYSNIILDLKPDKGHRILMQTSPCWIWSGSDFFVTSKGIIGTETTIGGFMPYEKKFPIGYRIRKAMQYGNTLDEVCDILLKENSGDYANSWLFGDVGTNEILRIELGLKYHRIERTKNGYFIGFNAPYDEKIRNLEVENSGFYDIRRHQGARKVRLSDLMDKHKGKLNVAVAQQIISDHYDVYLNEDNHPCSRTVCSHYDLDAREYMSDPSRPKPFAPHGAVDGMVCTSALAKKMSFIGKFGSSCNVGFQVDEYIRKHRQFENFKPYLKDRPVQPWTEFTVSSDKHGGTRNRKSRRRKKHRNRSQWNKRRSRRNKK